MRTSRRDVLALIAGALAASGLGNSSASASDELEARLNEFFGGGAPEQSDDFRFETPEIAESGNNVPVSVKLDSPMSHEDYVESIAIFAEKNPIPDVVVFHFTPYSGVASATTRVRLASTQNVIAVARTSMGKLYRKMRKVEVTIGGCGS